MSKEVFKAFDRKNGVSRYFCFLDGNSRQDSKRARSSDCEDSQREAARGFIQHSF